MRRLEELTLGPRAAWWAITAVMACVFLPPGAYFGHFFMGSVLKGELVQPGLTALGYAVYGLPGAVSVTCFGTVLLRLLGKPSAWLGCIGIALVILASFLGVIALII